MKALADNLYYLSLSPITAGMHLGLYIVGMVTAAESTTMYGLWGLGVMGTVGLPMTFFGFWKINNE